jgi:hypothetical protein
MVPAQIHSGMIPSCAEGSIPDKKICARKISPMPVFLSSLKSVQRGKNLKN